MENRKTVYIMYPAVKGRIEREVYGHFTEHIGGVIYDGIWVGKDSDIPNINGFRKDIVEKLRKINAPVIRWPGGCYAEIYDWRDGIGKDRPKRINWWTSFDKRYEPNTVGTHEFIDFCEAVGAKAYFAANLTSVTPMHIRNWMDYCLSPKGSTSLAREREENGHPEPFDIPFWGVGNENWGGGGNMLPDYYANEYRRFSTIMDNVPVKKELYVCGTNADDYSWTDGVMRNLSGFKNCTNGFAMHYYCGAAGDPLNFTQDEWVQMMRQAEKMEDIIIRNWHIICAYDKQAEAKLVIDEWGCWHPDGSGPSKGYNLFEQQSTMRDAMVAALTLNIFNNHCEKIRMANVAQTVNNLHSLFLSCGNDCITTPTYHVFDMYKDHQGAEAVETIVTDNDDINKKISISASVKDGKTLVTIANLSCTDDSLIDIVPVGNESMCNVNALLLSGDDMHAHNTFDAPDNVAPKKIDIDITKPFTVPKAGILALHIG